jgi:hypothetical protein
VYHAWQVDGRRYLTFARAGSLRILSAPGVGTFAVDAGACEIRWRAAKGATSDAMRTLLVNHVLPLVLSAERLILHASAVQVGPSVVGFVGAPGRGKSTLAAALARAGARVVADDALVLERRGSKVVAVPFGLGLRLCPDAARAVLGKRRAMSLARSGLRSSKRFVPQDGTSLRFTRSSSALRRLYVLDVPRTRRITRVDRLAGAEAVLPLVSCAFQLDLEEPQSIRTTFERVLHLVQAVPVRRLRAVRRLDALDEVVAAVRQDIDLEI